MSYWQYLTQINANLTHLGFVESSEIILQFPKLFQKSDIVSKIVSHKFHMISEIWYAFHVSEIRNMQMRETGMQHPLGEPQQGYHVKVGWNDQYMIALVLRHLDEAMVPIEVGDWEHQCLHHGLGWSWSITACTHARTCRFSRPMHWQPTSWMTCFAGQILLQRCAQSWWLDATRGTRNLYDRTGCVCKFRIASHCCEFSWIINHLVRSQAISPAARHGWSKCP